MAFGRAGGENSYPMKSWRKQTNPRTRSNRVTTLDLRVQCHGECIFDARDIMHKRRTRSSDETLAAGNGLLDRRRFLAATSAIAGAMGSASLPRQASAQELSIEPWMKVP